ncbi:BTAD domain-containing putative transcriptional regulator [Micromonospora sp. NPDC048842]|uniref:AfsR/SARP family transcriptional regulator n=1 Tax=Micromonospora sp. NPDC048842 TaxID=3154346 RepID=UPI0033E00AD2
MGLSVELLGTMRVVVDGEAVVLPSGRQRSLLALLLMDGKRMVSRDRVMAELWPSAPPQSAAVNLRTYAWGLRSWLARVTGAGGQLVRNGAGWALRLVDDTPLALDVVTFERDVAAGLRALTDADLASATWHLHHATQAYRGVPLLNVPQGPVLSGWAVLLHNRWVEATEGYAEVLLRTERFGAVRELLQGFVGQHPGRERAWGQLMAACARGGDTTGAVATYRAARTALVEGFGMEPGADLTALYRAVLRREPEMTPPHESTARRERVSVVGPAGPLRQLPADLPVLFGRETTVRGLLDALSHSPVVPGRCRVAVVVGPAGVGKTALAIHLAHLLRPAGHGAHLFVDLGGPVPASSRPPQDTVADALDPVVIRLLHAFGVTGERLPVLPADRHALLRGCLAESRALLILDDATDLAQIRALLPGDAACTVIVTSRHRLAGLTDVHRVDLGPLDPVAAELMFRTRTGLVSADESTRSVVASCAGLPLALLITAGRLAGRPPAMIRRLALALRDERRHLDELVLDDLSVRARVAVSYRAVGALQRRALHLVSAAGAAGIPAGPLARPLRLAETGVELVLEQLADAHLVTMSEPTSQAVRYRTPELVRLLVAEDPDIDQPGQPSRSSGQELGGQADQRTGGGPDRAVHRGGKRGCPVQVGAGDAQ